MQWLTMEPDLFCQRSKARGDLPMKATVVAIILTTGVIAAAQPALAKGCLKGAVVGGVAGHLVGHGMLGAVAGCAIGHHEAKKHERQRMEQRNGGSNVTPDSAPEAPRL
jgi:hypothetical protein